MSEFIEWDEGGWRECDTKRLRMAMIGNESVTENQEDLRASQRVHIEHAGQSGAEMIVRRFQALTGRQ